MQNKKPIKELSDAQLMRYSRHIMLKDFDIDGQERISNSSAIIIGLGGLGCAVAQYLSASGVGKLILVDDDEVDSSNLQRQVLHYESNIRTKKVLSAKQTINMINSEVDVETIAQRLSEKQLEDLIKQHDIVVDCCDNLETRNQLNHLCFITKTPLVSGAAIRFEGHVSVFGMQPGQACYQCLSKTFEEQTLTCVDAGVLSPLVGMVGSMQAIEAIKLLANVGIPLFNSLITIDASTMNINRFTINPSNTCPTCSGH